MPLSTMHKHNLGKIVRMSIANCQRNFAAFFTSQTKTRDELEAAEAPRLHMYGS